MTVSELGKRRTSKLIAQLRSLDAAATERTVFAARTLLWHGTSGIVWASQ